MTKENQDFEMREGDSKVIETTDGVKDEDGDVLDVTGFDGQFTLAVSPQHDEHVLQYDQTDNRFIIADGPNGIVQCELQPGDTDGFGDHGDEGVEYYYEIELHDAGGHENTVTTGTITIKESF